MISSMNFKRPLAIILCLLLFSVSFNGIQADAKSVKNNPVDSDIKGKKVLNKENVTIKVGEVKKLTGVSKVIKWSSSDKKIAKVNKKGRVTGMKEGKCIISAETKDKIYNFNVTVKKYSVSVGWGPERETFTKKEPASFPTFNSITDNSTIGDERDFVRIGQINADVTELSNEVEIIPGRQYLVYIYFHNNASSTFNSSEYDRSGVALVTRMSSSFTKVLTPEKDGVVTGTITADNTIPEAVWDSAAMTTKAKKVLLSYVEGSAKIYNNWEANGQGMPSSLFTPEGTLIGLNALNGVIPGCEEYHGVVSYVISADELSGDIDNSISVDGKKYSSEINAEVGNEILFKTVIKNIGDVELTNPVVKVSFPSGLELISGSVEYWANDSTVKDKFSDNLVSNGFNFGKIGTGNTLYLTYKAKIVDNGDGVSDFQIPALLIYDSDVNEGDRDESIVTIHVK